MIYQRLYLLKSILTNTATEEIEMLKIIDRSSNNFIVGGRYFQCDQLVQNRPGESGGPTHVEHNVGILSNMLGDNFLKPVI